MIAPRKGMIVLYRPIAVCWARKDNPKRPIISLDLNIIWVTENTCNMRTVKDLEGKGLQRYKRGLSYLIRPDGYIRGILEIVNDETISKYID